MSVIGQRFHAWIGISLTFRAISDSALIARSSVPKSILTNAGGSLTRKVQPTPLSVVVPTSRIRKRASEAAVTRPAAGNACIAAGGKSSAVVPHRDAEIKTEAVAVTSGSPGASEASKSALLVPKRITQEKVRESISASTVLGLYTSTSGCKLDITSGELARLQEPTHDNTWSCYLSDNTIDMGVQ